MGLEEFITEEPENEWHENDKLNLKRLFDDNICSSCGEESEETEFWYRRCTNTDCSVITFIPAKRDIEDASM